jgi:hypothetical protein
MITEDMVPLKDRIFTIEAILSVEMMNNYIQPKMELKKKEYKDKIDIELKKAIDHYENITKTSTQLYCFSSFSYADLEDGKVFDVLYLEGKMASGIKQKIIIQSFINEWVVLPMGRVGHGHRSICLIDFPDGIPDIISQIPIINDVNQRTSGVIAHLCSEETWKLRLSTMKDCDMGILATTE